MHLIPLILTTAMAHAEPLPISIPINAVRASHDVPQLASTLELDCAARRHARDLAKSGRCDPLGSDGSTLQDRAAACGTQAWAQIIGCGYASSEAVVQDWARDPGSREILLDGDAIAMGTARVGKVWVVVFK